MAEKYNAEDFLTAHEYATKHGISQEIVEKAINELKGVTLKQNTIMKKPIIVSIGSKRNAPRIRPEPEAQMAIAEKIKQIQKRGI